MANRDSKAHLPHIFMKYLTGSFKGERTISITQGKIASDFPIGYKGKGDHYLVCSIYSCIY